MDHRPAVSNSPAQVVNRAVPSLSDQDRGSLTSADRVTPTTSDSGRDRRASLQTRPSSAPGGTAESSQDELEIERTKRRPKPLLQRSKSDIGPRGEDAESQAEEDMQDWGARHGFEDHYASEEYVSQLANVGHTFRSCH